MHSFVKEGSFADTTEAAVADEGPGREGGEGGVVVATDSLIPVRIKIVAEHPPETTQTTPYTAVCAYYVVTQQSSISGKPV